MRLWKHGGEHRLLNRLGHQFEEFIDSLFAGR
jgi:hypothetical protein